jgi:hypothetical protein
MKSTIFKVLSSSATFFALCASVTACPGGGNRPNSYPSYPSYPPQYSTVNSMPVGPITSNLVSPAAVSNVASPAIAAAPQARISVVSASAAPVGNLQLASPVSSNSEAKSTVKETPVPEVKTSSEIAATTDLDLSKVLGTSATPKVDTSKIADAIKGLVGTWMAVSRQGDGALSTVELQMDDSGWAKLTVPGADGKPSTTTRKVEFENNELKLTGEDADVMLGKLVTFDSRQMVLERSGGQVTFVRP